MKINTLIRNNVARLTPYQSARRIGGTGDVWLNANEFPTSEPITITFDNLNRYPECQPSAVINRYATYAGVAPEQLIVTRGADEGIELLIKAFCEPREDAIMICPPTYGMYAVCAQTADVTVKTVPLTAQWQLNLPAMLAELDKVKLIYICSPNNPTGNLLNAEDIRQLLQVTKDRAIVVLDEAYIEFSPENSFVETLSRYPNLVILRTLSKAFALAGLRCGFTLASPEIIATLLKVIAPYPLSGPVAQIAALALTAEGIAGMRSNVAQIVSRRAQLSQALQANPVIEAFYLSESNYILIKSPQSADLFRYLGAQGIIVRDQSMQTNLANCLRISIGDQRECDRLLSAINQFSQNS